MSEWKPISTAPAGDRILVAGWQEKSGIVPAYWWWHEDHTNLHGQPMEFPKALAWKPAPELPKGGPEQFK